MPGIVTRIKQDFDAKKTRKDEKENGLQNFWNANDYFSLPEILPSPSPDCPDNVVSLFVGESDIFSAAHKIPGNIIICDIDCRLLEYIKEQEQFLRQLYQEYISEKIPFTDVVERYSLWLISKSEHHPLFLKARRNVLGQFHFLYSENNYVQAMQALQQKEIVTLDIDLFDREEQNDLCQALQKEGACIELLNLTNLPDYDYYNALRGLLKNIPWSDHAMVSWNIHDRGPLKGDNFYIHYPFIQTPREYLAFRTKPDFFADIDRLSYGPQLEEDLSLIERYESEPARRERYLAQLAENRNEKFTISDVCQFYQVGYLPRNREAVYFINAIESIFLSSDQFKTDPCIKGLRLFDLRSVRDRQMLKRDITEHATKKYMQLRNEPEAQSEWKKILDKLFKLPIFDTVAIAMHQHFFSSTKAAEEEKEITAANDSNYTKDA